MAFFFLECWAIMPHIPREDERKEFAVMLEGFSVALDSRDSLMIRAIWLGLRRALADEKLCLKDIEKVDESLRLYLVSK